MFNVTPDGTEKLQTIPGNQTTFDLRDLPVGVPYGIGVTALVGENEGETVTVFINTGEQSYAGLYSLSSINSPI